MIKPWIENISREDIARGLHYDAGINSMLIQLTDPDCEHPPAIFPFKEVRQYKFLDVEDTDIAKHKWAITDEQAKSLAEDLRFAYNNHMNVVVHCHMGICRSGAVVECGVMIGFMDTERFRAPNLMVKHRIMHHLGML